MILFFRETAGQQELLRIRRFSRSRARLSCSIVDEVPNGAGFRSFPDYRCQHMQNFR